VQGRALAAGDRLAAAAVGHAASGAAIPDAVLRSPPAGSQGNAGPLPSFLDPLGGPDAKRQVWGRSEAPIRVVPGPQDDHFDAEAMATFFSAGFRVSRDADRMGLRLEGPALQHRADKGAEIVSDATVPGSIQVPGNGLPIVLLADGQTAGGYPKIATVIGADLARLANAAVGALLHFAPVSVAQAEVLAREREAEVQRCLAAIEPLTLVDGVDLAALYANNLVSAMIDALQPPN
jgi:allophanate hydrolase